MRVKLLLRWDIKDESETDYYEFIVNEFIPRLKRLGLNDVEFWYTVYGEVEQIQASAIANTEDQMDTILASDDWDSLVLRLGDYVTDLTQKIVPATSGFQI